MSGRDRGNGRLLEREVRRHARDFRPRTRAYSANDALGDAEHLSPRSRVVDTRADCIDDSRPPPGPEWVLRLRGRRTREAHRIGHAGHQMPDAAIEACCPGCGPEPRPRRSWAWRSPRGEGRPRAPRRTDPGRSRSSSHRQLRRRPTTSRASARNRDVPARSPARAPRDGAREHGLGGLRRWS